MAHNNQIEAALKYLQQGDCKRALKAAKLAAKQSPQSPLPPNVTGIALSALGQSREAVPFFKKALNLKPDFVDALQNLAQALIAINRPDQALLAIGKWGSAEEHTWKHHYLLAQAHLAMGQESSANEEIGLALDAEPNRSALLHLQSQILLGLGRIADAIGALRKALEINPADVNALINLSLPLARHSESKAALDTVTKAIEVDPTNVAARFRLANQLVEMGQMSDAKDQYRALLNIDPSHAATLERLVEILDPDEAVDLESQVRTALAKVPRNSEDRACLLYALSAVSVASGKDKETHKALVSANQEMAHLYPYDPVGDTSVTQAILGRFPEARQSPNPVGAEDSPYPIFILGLPRSGTTLAEAILGMHPNVTPLGERGTLAFLLRQTIENDLAFTQQDSANLMQRDKELLPPLPDHTTAYTDKMPENYRITGFLEMIHPNAKVIHIRRDPRDNALSMWKSHFSGSVLSYTYDLRWMAAKFNLYDATMAHWHKVLPDRVLDIHYEDMVANVETVGQKMASFCGLEWHPAMARPDKCTAQVLTLSATQLRRPVHKDSVGKWRAHLDVLEPFINALDPGIQRRLSSAA